MRDPIWLLQFLQASVSCMLAGLLTWAVLRVALRRWPALASRRAIWPAAQGVIAAVFMLALPPQGARFSVLPAVTLTAAPSDTANAANAADAAAPPVRTDAKPTMPDRADASATPMTTATRPVSPGLPTGAPATASQSGMALAAPAVAALLLWLPACWLLAYFAGLTRALWRLARARLLWRDLLAGAQRLSPQALREHGAFSAAQLAELERHGLTVLETDAAISPMLIGVLRACLLLPRHLRSFSAQQQQMIIEHELTHRRRRDPLYLALSCALQTVFWFNPALRWLDRKLAWAQELSCDQQVLAGRPQQQRQHYAAALLLQLKAQCAPLPSAGLAFGAIDGDSVAARVRQLRDGGIKRLGIASKCALAVLPGAVVAASLLLRPAFAFALKAPATAPAAAPAPTSAPDAEAWRYPLDHMRVLGFFNVHRDVLPTPHRGIDLAASNGTPVHAAAAGTVISAGPLAEHDGGYGTAVIIDHGGRRQTLYAHLGGTAVKAGDHVVAGQVIGATGASGFATGPHLHFELRQDGRPIDPQLALAGLDQYATRHALSVRRQQLGH